jgi:hypothetical protein
MASAGDPRTSSMSGLNVMPKAAMTGLSNREACAATVSMTCRGLASLTSRAVRISRDSSGAASTMNHGSTAMQ